MTSAVKLYSLSRNKIILCLLTIAELDQVTAALKSRLNIEMVSTFTRLEALSLDLSLAKQLVSDVSLDPVPFTIHEGDRDAQLWQDTFKWSLTKGHRCQQMIDALLCRFALHAVLDDPFCEDRLFFIALEAVVTDAPHDARLHHVLCKVVPSHPVEVCRRESKRGP